MDTIFYNGIIHTLDKAYPEVSALAIKDGVILRLGSDEEILALKDPQTRLIDLQGRLMLPGFADTHLHLLFYGTFRRRIDLVNTTTYEEVVRMCREGAEKVRGTNRWVIGCNFNQINWTDTNKIPDRNDLDAIASDVPIFLQRACGHIVCMNTMALQLAGLWDEREATTKQTMDFGPRSAQRLRP